MAWMKNYITVFYVDATNDPCTYVEVDLANAGQ